MRSGLKIRELCAPLAALFLFIGAAIATAQSPAVHPGSGASALERPKVVLIGDSIRLGYAPLVAKRLAERAQVVSPAPNGGDSAHVLKNLEMVEAKAGGVYAALGAAEKFRSRLYPEVGHEYTPAMRAAVLEWFDRWLRPEPSQGARRVDESPVSKKMSN